MITWITEKIGTGAFSKVKDYNKSTNITLIDVRSLVDKAGNNIYQLQQHIRNALKALKKGNKVVICCDHGISRSNAIASAILSRWESLPLSEALQHVLEATNGAEIHIDVITSIQQALEVKQQSIQKNYWLVTGAHGYLGSILTQTAPQEVTLLCPTYQELNLMSGAAIVDLYIKEHRVSKIIHLASPHIGNTNSAFGNTLVMLRNVIDACTSNNIPLFFPSRHEVFGGHFDSKLIANEDTELCPTGILGDTKYLSEMLVETSNKQSKYGATILRSGLVYGRAGGPNFIKYFLRQAREGKTIITHQYNNGNPAIDLIHADDWASACWSLLQSDLYGVFNVGGGLLTSTEEIARHIIQTEKSKSNLEVISIDRPVTNVLMDYKKIKDQTSWAPSISFYSTLIKNEFAL